MPAYIKKITRLMDYKEFSNAILELSEDRQALLSILFFAGCRVSEALALTSNDISCTGDTIFIQFFRLKGSKQTDPQELPRADALLWLCKQICFSCSRPTSEQEGRLFSFTRMTAYRTVKKVFSDLYPHYFRMNRVTDSLKKFDAATVCNVYGMNLNSINHYIGKVDIKRVGVALREELG